MIEPVSDQEDSGFALVVVLGFLFVVALMTSPFVLQARTEFKIKSNAQELARMEMLAEGIMEVITAKILNPDTSEASNIFIKRKECVAGSNFVSISVQDHRGLIDLNSASRELLAFGFRALEIDRITADLFAKTVIYLRSIEFGPAPLGVFSTHSNRKFGRFASALELMDIAGTRKLNHRNIHDVFTVHTGAVRLVEGLASLPIQIALEDSAPTTLPVTPGSNVAFPNGVYTLSVTLRRKSSKLLKKLTKIVAIGIHDGKPLQHLESVPSDLLSDEFKETDADCAAVLGASVSRIIESTEG